MPTILLLGASNLFMTIAWYWHLKGGMARPLLLVIFMVSFLGEPLHWRHLATFACIMAAVGFLFVGR